MKKIILDIGDIVVSSESVILETILGSCVSVCLWDQKFHIGGMNHFMMPKMSSCIKHYGHSGTESVRMLINNLIGIGSDIRHMKAKIFGGNTVIKYIYDSTCLVNIGKENIMTAKEILKEYNIPIISEFTGQDIGIKVIFHTDTGRTFVKELGIQMQNKECEEFPYDKSFSYR